MDARFWGGGYSLLAEVNPDQQNQSKRKTYALVALTLNIFSTAQLKMSIRPKEVLPIYMALLEFAQFLWETSESTIVLTDNKLVTQFFETKVTPPMLWIALDYVLQVI